MRRKAFIFFLVVATLSGCISNDLPYPVVVPHITSLSADGAKNVAISQDRRSVTITLKENVNPRKVFIRNCEIDEKMTESDVEIVGIHDLTKPLTVVLRTYQDYEWTILAQQPIDRRFTVNGQIGSTEMDAVNHRAIAYVGNRVDISNVTVTSLKLGPADVSTYSRQMESMKDFQEGITVEVTAFGVTEEWHLFVEQTDAVVEMTDVNPWTREVYLTCTGVAGQKNGFRYRVKGNSAWTQVGDADISSDGGTFTAHITGLEPETLYEAVAFCNEEQTQVYEFTTDPATQAPNHSFDNVSLVTGEKYYKWYNPYSADSDGREMFWGTGNGEGPDGINGTSTLGITLTYPDASEAQDGQFAVRCESKSFAGLLACGNIFAGQFAGLVGTTGGKVNYGRPWSTRPRSMRIKLKYNSGIIDLVGSYPPDDPVKAGDNDRGHIIVALGDWDYRTYGGTKNNPVLVNTSAGIYFTKESPGIIAYGEYVQPKSTNGWIEVEIPIEYRSLTRKPTHIIIICAASMRGDYLTGSSRTTLWVDDFDLIY